MAEAITKWAKGALCPVCGGQTFYHVPLGRADTWYRQLDKVPQWKKYRGLPETAGVAFSEPRLEWQQPTFELADRTTEHVRCKTCASLLPPQFVREAKSRVLLITTGMPQAGKTTWLKCLFRPARKKHLIAEPTSLITREPYYYIEPFTIANPDPRTAIPLLLHGIQLKFQRQSIDLAGIDIKGEVFHQQSGTSDKYLRVLDVLKNLRSMKFDDLFLMFVVPFDPTHGRQNIGELATDLMNEPGLRGAWQGVIWTHLDHAQLRSEAALLEFLKTSDAATSMVRRAAGGTDDVFDSRFVTAATEIEQLIQKKRAWSADLELLESLTWLLYRVMTAYSALPARYHIGNVEFYYSFNGGLGSILVRHWMRVAAALFAAWDSAGRGDFAPMVRESLMPGTELRFPVLPCGMEFLQGGGDGAEEGLPVWGDLLLLEILRRHG